MRYFSNTPFKVTRLSRAEVADLLLRYPKVSDLEVRQILNFLSSGRHLEVGLLTSNDRIGAKLDAFFDDHKARLRLKWDEGAAAIGGIAALFVIVWLIWEAFT